MSVYLNTFETKQGLMVAVADEDIIGEVFRENGVSLDISRDFYCGEISAVTEVEEKLSKAAIANLVGVDAVEIGVEFGLVDEENVLVVEDVPHAQMVRV